MGLGLFAEDQGHAAFLRAVVERMAREEGVAVRIEEMSARGGHGRALAEFRLYCRTLDLNPAKPGLVVIGIDANCVGWNAKRQEIRDIVSEAFPSVIACPDPHVERWYMADPETFHSVVGVEPRVEQRKCERGRYKQILETAILDAGHPATLGGIEFASDLVAAMDFFRAGKNEPSLKNFLDDLRAGLRLTRR